MIHCLRNVVTLSLIAFFLRSSKRRYNAETMQRPDKPSSSENKQAQPFGDSAGGFMLA